MKRTFLAAIVSLFFLSTSDGQKVRMKPLNDLINTEEPGWETISQWSLAATNKIEILPRDKTRADSALYQTQLTTASPVAAMVYGCGGILVDHGWIRILGSGCKQLDRSLPSWNRGKSYNVYPGDATFLLVADDVLGGFFAINAGGIDLYDVGKVFYYGPNKLKWETTGLGYNEFIVFCFSGDIDKFYKGFRWSGWENEVRKLNGNEVITCYPLLWTDAGKDLIRNRKVMSIQKLWSLYQPMKKKGMNRNPGKKTAVHK